MSKRTITAKDQPVGAYLQRLWSFRRLVKLLALRDLKVQYAQTVLGISWSILQPLTGLLIFTFFFDKIMNIDTGGIPYPLIAFSGMISWYYFGFMVGNGGTSLIQSQELIRKINFPKLVLPLSKSLTGFIEFGISLVLLFIMMLILRYPVSINLVFLPLFLIMNIITGLTVAIWLGSLTVRYRDFQHIIPYLINFGIWVTPVFYPSTLIPEKYKVLLYLNPMAGVISGFRFCLLGTPPPDKWYLLTFSVVIVAFLGGIRYFQKMERKIPDLV
jgi:lipopolysaccharide transport system permease protein